MIVEYRPGRMEGPILLNERFIWMPGTEKAKEVRVVSLKLVDGEPCVYYFDQAFRAGNWHLTEEQFRQDCIRAAWR